MKRFGDILDLTRTPIAIDDDQKYARIGIYSWGKGMIHHEPVPASGMGRMKYFTFPQDSLIFSNIQAWEGAVALSTSTEDGFVCSNRFYPYIPKNDDAVNLHYLYEFFRSARGLAIMRACSPGTQVRNKVLSRKALESSLIPLPSRADQDRVAAHLDSLAAIEQRSRESVLNATQLYARLGEHVLGTLFEQYSENLDAVLSSIDQLEPVDLNTDYPTLGIRAHAKGAFHSGVTRGSETSYKKLRRFNAGQVAYPKLMGWQGAFTIVQDELDGFYASPEFVGFNIDSTKANVDFIKHCFSWRPLVAAATAKASGTNANRRRLQPGDFLQLEIPLPPLETQQTVASQLNLAREIVERSRLAHQIAAKVLPTARNQIFTALEA